MDLSLVINNKFNLNTNAKPDCCLYNYVCSFENKPLLLHNFFDYNTFSYNSFRANILEKYRNRNP